MYAEEWLGHSLLRCGTSYELGFRKAEEKLSKELRDNFELGVITGVAQERQRNLELLQGLIEFNKKQPSLLRRIVVKTLEQLIPYVKGEN